MGFCNFWKVGELHAIFPSEINFRRKIFLSNYRIFQLFSAKIAKIFSQEIQFSSKRNRIFSVKIVQFRLHQVNEWMNECSPMFNLNVLWFFQALHQPASHKMRCLFFQSYLCGFPSLSRPMYLVSLMNQQEELRNEHESRLIKHTVLSHKNVSRVGKSLMHRCSRNFML